VGQLGSLPGDRTHYDGEWVMRACHQPRRDLRERCAEGRVSLGRVDVNGKILDTSQHNYTPPFRPQAAAAQRECVFWSLTMYDGKSQF